MSTLKKELSVTRAAEICGVSRSTAGYWIRSKKLRANQVGRNYSIPVEELLFFLKSTGHKIPAGLADGNLQAPCFGTIQNCWQYWKGSAHGQGCKDCMVFKNQIIVCFTAKESNSSRCPKGCNECQYYLETYLPRIQFVHQMELPAAVYKDLYFWGGNRKFAELCDVQEMDLIGMGIEYVVHADSLKTVITNAKKRALGDSKVPRTYSIFLKNRHNGKLKVRVKVYPLSEPAGGNFVLAERRGV